MSFSVSKICSTLLLLTPALCHMEMSWPYPFRSKYNPANDYTNIDYSMTSPLIANGSNFPCKGYQNDGFSQPTETYTAGSMYNISLAGTVTHGGGSCQISLSYDNGGTFRVIKSMIGGCPLESTFNFTIPSYVPSATSVLLAWTWQNNEGNRELYMNCAEVSIVSAPKRRHRHHRKNQAQFDQLPYIWKANIAGINGCNTTEGVNPVYPHPGPDVVYANGMSSSDPPTAGDCDAATPYGQTYVASTGSSAVEGATSASEGSLPTTSNTIAARSFGTRSV